MSAAADVCTLLCTSLNNAMQIAVGIRDRLGDPPADAQRILDLLAEVPLNVQLLLSVIETQDRQLRVLRNEALAREREINAMARPAAVPVWALPKQPMPNLPQGNPYADDDPKQNASDIHMQDPRVLQARTNERTDL